MAELPELVRWGVAGAALVLLFAFAWVAMAPMPRLARVLARLCLIALAVLPIALLVMTDQLGLPDIASRSTDAAPPPAVTEAPPPETAPTAPAPSEAPPQRPRKKAAAPKPVEPVPAEAGAEAARRLETEAAAEAARRLEAEQSAAAARQLGGGGDGAARPAVPPMVEEGIRGLESEAPAARSPPFGGGGGGGGAAGTPPPDPGGGTAKTEDPKEGFDVVPVYYGTDRADASTDKRLDYGATRGRKLTLGQALVTVPKSHVQPTIERPWAIRIPYFDITLYEEAEDPNQHFTMKELKACTREEFLALVRERLAKSERFKDHALVFVHGFNTTFDNAAYRTAQITYDLKFDGAPFLYSWPSGGGVASYTYDRESAGQAEPYLRQFLDLVIKETGAKSVSVIAHSMGNQPTLQVLKDIKSSSPPGIVISQIILAAPDVDRDNFENIAREIQGLASGITLYAAANDRALGVSRRFNGGVPRAGDVPAEGPLVLPGVDTIDVTAVSTDSFGLNHSGYAENNALLNDLQLLIQTGERPPEKRIPLLEKIGTAAGDYWRYPRVP